MALRRKLKHAPIFGLLTILSLGVSTGAARAAIQAGSPNAAARIVDAIDEAKRVPLAGQSPRFANANNDQGAVSDSFPMEHLLLQLRRGPAEEEALEREIDELQDQASGKYHQWLSAEELGTRFGPAQGDVDAVVRWLGVHEFRVNSISKNGLMIDVSGTAGQLREAFHTEIHNYIVNGKNHIANASVPEVPAALASVVVGFTSLHDMMPKPLLIRPKTNFTFPCNGCPNGFDGVVFYDEAPADLATIYNATPLYTAKTPITGKGQTVVVLEDTDILSADVAKFRSSFGLSKYSGTFTQIHPGTGCKDPGRAEAEGEAALDAEWAGAVAPDAKVELASCADTTTNFGGFIAAQNLLDSKSPPPIMSLSYGQCEVQNGPAGIGSNPFINALWQQAAIEGVSVFVSTGDGSAAVCDDFNTALYAVDGIAANGYASTPYDTATGGTDFLDSAEGTVSTYWSNGNSASRKSAKSYIPEMTWEDSCASNVLFSYYGFPNGAAFCNSSLGENFLGIGGGSGGPSHVYSKPKWQAGIIGNPSDGKRDLPDISLFASNGFWSHAIVFCMSDAEQGGAPCSYSNPTDALINSAGGTSFTAPQFASIQALINQKAGGRQGNPAPIYYKLAKAEYGSGTKPDHERLQECNASKGKDIAQSCIFHDVTVGSIDVPCHGTHNCYTPRGDKYGVLSTSDSGLKEAYPATTGWDFTSGIGSPNIENLVKNWP
jgi:subtilase family serine protease